MIDGQMMQLRSILTGGGTAAAVALKELIPGGIVVTEKPKPDSKDMYLQGTFTMGIGRLPSGHDVANEAGNLAVESAEHTVEIREPAEFEVLADAVKAAWDDRKKIKEIAAALGKPAVPPDAVAGTSLSAGRPPASSRVRRAASGRATDSPVVGRDRLCPADSPGPTDAAHGQIKETGEVLKNKNAKS